MNTQKMAIIISLILIVVPSIHAQDKFLHKNEFQIADLREMMKSENVMERRKAASNIRLFKYSADEIGPDFMNEIIDLLIKEENLLNEVRKARGLAEGAIPSELFGGGEGGALYIANLCGIIGKSGNLKILPLLMKYGTSGKDLIGYGEEAVKYYFEGIEKSSTERERVGFYLGVLGYWLQDKKEGYIATGETRKRIKTELFTRALSEKEYSIKVTAILALTKVGDRDLITIFEKIAASDPWHAIDGKGPPTDRELPPGTKAIRYPLREIAQRELEKRKK